MEYTISLGNPLYYLTTHFSLLLLIILQERVRNSLKWNLEIHYQQDIFSLPLLSFGLDCCKEIPQLWVPNGDDGPLAVPEECICQGWIHQHLCSRQRNRASLCRCRQAAQQVLTDPCSSSASLGESHFTDTSPCCLKIYFIIMLSGWHPCDFTCSSVLVRTNLPLTGERRRQL